MYKALSRVEEKAFNSAGEASRKRWHLNTVTCQLQNVEKKSLNLSEPYRVMYSAIQCIQNRGSQIFWFQGPFLFLKLLKIPEVGLLGHMAVLFPVFQEISTLFSIAAVLVCIPTNSVRGFPFLHILSSIYCLQTFGQQTS